MSDNAPSLAASIEAILMVADEPIDEVTLAQVLETPRDEIAATLHRLTEEYTQHGRGFELRSVAGGWRFYTRAECAAVVERFVLDGQQARLTQAALETLAVVAYRQPVSRARVSAVRGVNCDGVMRTLTTRGLVEEAGVDTDSGATLYRTTSYFLERLGLTSLNDLPPLADYLPEADEVDAEPGETPRPRSGQVALTDDGAEADAAGTSTGGNGGASSGASGNGAAGNGGASNGASGNGAAGINASSMGAGGNGSDIHE